MAEITDAIVEKAAQAAMQQGERDTLMWGALELDCGTYKTLARAVLDAVADDLRGGAWDEGYRYGAQDHADNWLARPGESRRTPNPYREEADHG